MPIRLHRLGVPELISFQHLSDELLSDWLVTCFNFCENFLVGSFEYWRWQIDSRFNLVLLTAQPWLKKFDSVVVVISLEKELVQAPHVLSNELTIKVILATADVHHGFDAVGFWLWELACNTPRGFFKFLQYQIDLFVSCLYDIEILLKVPFSFQLTLQAANLHIPDSLLVKHLCKFNTQVIQCKLRKSLSRKRNVGNWL